MRKQVSILLLAGVLLAWWSCQRIGVQAQGGQEQAVARENGDTNGDQSIDITDASYFLNWLFLGGPAPVPYAPSGGSSGLPDTGQTKCHDQSGAEIPCDSATCPGQDGAYETVCPSNGTDGSGRFVDNGDGTVTDTCTGLMWQKETAPGTYTWCDALVYCEDLSFAGHDDFHEKALEVKGQLGGPRTL